MTTQPRKILVTCALPYANGAIHLGPYVRTHSSGYLGTFPTYAWQ